MAENKKINVRGVDFDNVTKSEAVSLLVSRLEEGKRTVVFTPNSEIVQACIEDASFIDVIGFADVTLPDGIGVIKAASILGTPLKEKVAGVEVGEALFSALADTSHSFFFFGGKANPKSSYDNLRTPCQKEDGDTPAVCEIAAEKMTEKYGCKIAGTRHGYFSKDGEENDKTVDEINASGADVLYVCLGSPVQEKWIKNNIDRLDNVKLVLGLGGSLDIYAGISKRAPSLFIKTGLEWLWRLLIEPSRLFRMMKLPKFYIGTHIYKMKNKK